jgi:S1-C subfamily serine protease
VILEPGSQYENPFESDAVGLRLKSAGPPHDQLEVSIVSAGSPAALAGLEVGDAILEVDGQPAAELRMWGVRKLFMKPGRQYDLKIRRGGRELRITLVTRVQS